MNCATGGGMTDRESIEQPQQHPEGNKVADGKQMLCFLLLAEFLIREQVRTNTTKGAALPEIPTLWEWRAALDSALTLTLGQMKKWRGNIVKQPAADRKRLRQRVDREANAAKAEHRRIQRQLDEIAEALPDEHGNRLTALYQNVVRHQRQQFATIPGSELGTPNWEAASSLTLASSEKFALQIGEAFERGRFQPVPQTPFPTAVIYTRDDRDPEDFAREVLMYAELVSNQRPNAEPTPAEQKKLRELAERLGDPRSAEGPRTAQLLGAILATWLRSRRDDNSVVVTIYQLAEMLRYSQHKSGGYRSRDLDEIRECWATLSMTRLSSQDGRRQGPLLAANEYGTDLKGLEASSAVDPQETITLAEAIKQTATARWTHLRVTPHEVFILLARAKSPLLMGRSDDLNRLHPVNERADLLLGKRLEVHFRFNWHRGRGLLTRTVEQLLDGAGLPTSPPRIATLRRLEAALTKLEEQHGTLREWRDMDGRFTEALESIGTQDALGYSYRMTDTRWRSALESRIELEAGEAYAAHYRNFGLAHQGKQTATLAADLQQYLAATGRSQAVVAEELGVSRQHLNGVLNGKRASPALEAKITAMLQQASTLPLPLE
jgi:predicted XRE-type DNA-binding protein